jgi:prepilin-type N-terminal cleavage/methylation domain-containing protein
MITRLRRGAVRQGGFTLTEMLVTILFIGMLFAAFATVMTSTLRRSDEVREESTAQAEVRAAIDRFAADLRQAYSGDDDVWPIVSIGSTQIRFYTPDRATPFHLRDVTYRLSGGQFQRQTTASTDTDGAPWSWGTAGPWETFAGNVMNSVAFTYFQADGVTPATVAADVRTVTVTLTVETYPGKTQTYDSAVTLRAS